MNVLEIPKLDLESLRFIYELHKQLEMGFALSAPLLGIDSGRSTAKEVEKRISREIQQTKMF